MSAALDVGLDHLTRMEQRVFDALHERLGSFVEDRELYRVVYESDYYVPHQVQTHLSRLRRKLVGTGWRLERTRTVGAYRLVREASDLNSWWRLVARAADLVQLTRQRSPRRADR